MSDASPEEAEQLAQSLAMLTLIGDRDRLRLIELLHLLARLLRGR